MILADLIQLNDVRMVQDLQYFHLAKDFLQIRFIQLCLVNDLYCNLHQHNTLKNSEHSSLKCSHIQRQLTPDFCANHFIAWNTYVLHMHSAAYTMAWCQSVCYKVVLYWNHRMDQQLDNSQCANSWTSELADWRSHELDSSQSSQVGQWSIFYTDQVVDPNANSSCTKWSCDVLLWTFLIQTAFSPAKFKLQGVSHFIVTMQTVGGSGHDLTSP